VLSRVTLILAAAVLALGAASLPSASDEPIQWRSSRSLGVPWDGRLVRGVRLPPEGEHFFTWDPVQKRSPDRPWRRWGTDRLLRMLLRVIDEYTAAHPEASRVGVGDLSRPHGGVFDERYGGRGHASHQNGRDVDVYYPRLDGQELRPARPAQVDRVLAQELVTRFVRAGAVKVFVGPRVGLRGPKRTVERLIYHDDHMHVRIGPDPERRVRIGHSTRGRPIPAFRAGDTTSTTRVLVVGCIHGNECAGTAVTRILARSSPAVDLWVSRTSTRTASPSDGARTPGASTSTATSPPSGWPAGAQATRSTRARGHSRSRRRAPPLDSSAGSGPRSRSGSTSRRRSCVRGARASRPPDGTRASPG
jgi:murein endopeptidase